MYFYQTLNQSGPSVIGFLVWEMSSAAVKREEQGEAAPREQRGAGLRAPLLWDGVTAQELSVEGGGWGVLHLSMGCRKLCCLVLVPDGRAWVGRGCGMGLWCPPWELHRVNTALLKQGPDSC